jgi:hypothetical protein
MIASSLTVAAPKKEWWLVPLFLLFLPLILIDRLVRE